MNKKLIIFMVASLISINTMISANAGEWKQDQNGWWYQNDDGSYPINEWEQINDGNYYFGNSGYMYYNAITPDGFYVGNDGKWEKNPPVAFKSKDEINQYLYENYRVLHTNLGDIEVGYKSGEGAYTFYSGNYVRENTTVNEAYDYIIYTMWSAYVREFYNNVIESINYTEEEKNTFKQCFKDFQYNMAQDIISKMPGKKIRGGFYSEGYEYPNLKVGYYNSVRYGWRNYERMSSKLEYYSFILSDFEWIDLWDEIK